MSRYDAVIHLRTPGIEGGYDHRNPLRTESAAAAAEIDERLLCIWEAHPRRFIVPSSPDFLEKAARVVAILRAEMPDCCREQENAVLLAVDGSVCSDAAVQAVLDQSRAGEALQSEHASHR